jgi:hypothetical protein
LIEECATTAGLTKVIVMDDTEASRNDKEKEEEEETRFI